MCPVSPCSRDGDRDTEVIAALDPDGSLNNRPKEAPVPQAAFERPRSNQPLPGAFTRSRVLCVGMPRTGSENFHWGRPPGKPAMVVPAVFGELPKMFLVPPFP